MTQEQKQYDYDKWFQSTHPRRVWHNDCVAYISPIGVSIHTPTKGVTLRSATALQKYKVSIHTPTKGVTNIDYVAPNSNMFQSTHPRRVWLMVLLLLQPLLVVSIHTPTKGVTLCLSHWRRLADSFNPHTHEGCDTTTIGHSSDYFSFNPHTHEGCDIEKTNLDWLPRVSIHTPTKGVTWFVCWYGWK